MRQICLSFSYFYDFFLRWRLREGKEGYVPSQRDGRKNTGVLLIDDIRFMSDQIMYDTLSEGERNNNACMNRGLRFFLVIIFAINGKHNIDYENTTSVLLGAGIC